MTREAVTIPVWRHRTPTGEPTCSTGVAPEATCLFMRLSALAGIESCKINGALIERAADGRGYTVPVAGCPLWGKP